MSVRQFFELYSFRDPPFPVFDVNPESLFMIDQTDYEISGWLINMECSSVFCLEMYFTTLLHRLIFYRY